VVVGCKAVVGAAVVGESGLFAVVWESTELGEDGALRLSGCKASGACAAVGKDGMMGGGFVDARVGDLSLAGGAGWLGGSITVEELSDEMVSSEEGMV